MIHRFFLGVLVLSLTVGQAPAADATAASSSPIAASGTWDFTYRLDDFSKDAVLDLRFLNERLAGEHGFIRLNGAGAGCVRGDEAPIRF